jgi:hypothetical protein
MLVPYFNLPGNERVRIALQEQQEGKVVWSEIETLIDGQPAKLLVCKEWGILLLGDRCLPLPQYPLQKLESIDFGEQAEPKDPGDTERPDV